MLLKRVPDFIEVSDIQQGNSSSEETLLHDVLFVLLPLLPFQPSHFKDKFRTGV